MGLPKILVGGVLIIDLLSLSLTPSVDMETYTPISNSEVLSQLLRLKQYIETPTAQKPLWVRMSYDGETITTMGALYKEDGEPHFKLIVKILDQRLIIDVTFTQDEETLEWYIDTEDAKYLFTSNSQEVDSYIADSISSGAIKSALDLKADLSGASFSGNVSVGGALSVTGDISGDDISGNSIIENMVGYSYDGTNKNASVSIQYVSVVKNGNKITFVYAGTIQSESQINAGSYLNLGAFIIPTSIGGKIYPLYTGGTIVDFKDGLILASDESVGITSIGYKTSNTNFHAEFVNKTNISANKEYGFRYEVTFLLSDNMISQE